MITLTLLGGAIYNLLLGIYGKLHDTHTGGGRALPTTTTSPRLSPPYPRTCHSHSSPFYPTAAPLPCIQCALLPPAPGRRPPLCVCVLCVVLSD